MIKFNNGILVPATDVARNKSGLSPSDLVQRTLAQHGLVSPLGSQHGGGLKSSMQSAGRHTSVPDSSSTQSVIRPESVPEGAQFLENVFSCAEGRRAFRIYLPSTVSTGVKGIVVMLHGCTQNAEDFAIGTGMNTLAEKQGFIVIYPQQSRGDNAQSCWNWFSRQDQQRDRGEPAILAGITRKVMKEFGISRECTFVAGLSAGAAMAVILGETYPDVFSAVGAHSGLAFGAAKDVPSAFTAMAGNALETLKPTPDAPMVRTIIFHGTADSTVHPSNGQHIARQAVDRESGQTTETDESGFESGRQYRCKITTDADGVNTVEHWLIDGLAHAWSGGQPGGSYTDTKGPDASAGMIRFFFNQ